MDVRPERVPEGMRHLEHREGLVEVGPLPIRAAILALRRSLPTRQHAVRFVGALLERLGDRAWLDPMAPEGAVWLHLAPDGLPGWPTADAMVRLDRSAAMTGMVMVNKSPDLPIPADAPEGWTWDDPWYGEADPEPELYPRGPEMCAGRLELRQGPSYLELRYDERGLFQETSISALDHFTSFFYGGVRPFVLDPEAVPPLPPPVGLVVHERLRAEGHGVEGLAEMAAELGPWSGRDALARVPTVVPGGVASALVRARLGLRRWLWGRVLPVDAAWLVVDGVAGSAVGVGPDLEAAAAAWAVEVQGSPPQPPEPVSRPSGSVPEGVHESVDRDVFGNVRGVTISVNVGGGDEAPVWPLPHPRTLPAVAFRLPAHRAIPEELVRARFGERVWVVEHHGAIRVAAKRGREDGGFELVGEHLWGRVDPAALEDELAAQVDDYLEMTASLPPDMREGGPWALLGCRAWDSGRRQQAPLGWVRCSRLGVFEAGMLDGGEVASCVTALVRVRP